MYISNAWIKFIALNCLLNVPYYFFKNFFGQNIASYISYISLALLICLLPRAIFSNNSKIPYQLIIMFICITVLVAFEIIGYFLGQRLGITIIRNLSYILCTALGSLIIIYSKTSEQGSKNLINFMYLVCFLVINEYIAKYLFDKVPSSELMYLSSVSVFVLLKYSLKILPVNTKYIILSILTLGPILSGVAGSVLTLVGSIILSQNKKNILYMIFILLSFISIAYLYSVKYLSFNYNDIFQGYFIGFSSSDYISTIDINEGNSQSGSSYIRNATNYIALMEFFQNPLFGAGNSFVKNELQVSGYWTHTYLIYVAASYGLIGLSSVLYFIKQLIGTSLMKPKDQVKFFFIISIMLLFTNELYLFLPVMTACIYTSLKKTHSLKQTI